MKPLALLLAFGILTVCASGQEPEQQVVPEITPTFDSLLKDKDPAVRERAALAICQNDRRASNRAIPALTDLLSDPNESVRVAAAAALSWRGPAAEPAIPALVKVIGHDTSPDVRNHAALALRTAGPKGVQSVFALLDDKNGEVRRTAIGVVGGWYGEEPHETPLTAVPKLVALLKDEVPEVRSGAAIALVRITGVPADVIDQLLHHDDVNVRHVAANGLLLNMLDRTKRFRPAMLVFMDNDMAFCRDNANLLSRAGPKSVPVLVKLLDDVDPSVRGDAASALGELGPAAKEAADALKRLLKDLAEIPHADLDDRVCHRAGLALNQILGDKNYQEGLPYKRPDGL